MPLSPAAVAVLRALAPPRNEAAGDWVFPSAKHGQHLTGNELLRLMRRMGISTATVHGFRSSFRDWAAETGKAPDIAEAALAHRMGTKTQLAYQRGDLLQRRRHLMAEWATFCATPTGSNIVVLTAS